MQQQPYAHPPLPQTTESRPYEYSIQATEDYHYEDLGPRERREEEEDATPVWHPPSWRPKGTPNYKPKPLRWPFITAVIFFLVVAIILVAVAVVKMPDSDSSAEILGLHPNISQPSAQPARLLLARDAAIANISAATDTYTVPVVVSATGVLSITSYPTSISSSPASISSYPTSISSSPASISSSPASTSSNLASTSSNLASTSSSPASISSNLASISSNPASASSNLASTSSNPASTSSTPTLISSTPTSISSTPTPISSTPTSTLDLDQSVTSPATEGSTTVPDDDASVSLQGLPSTESNATSRKFSELPSSEVVSAQSSGSTRTGPPIRVIPSGTTRSMAAETTSIALSVPASRTTGSTDFNFQNIETSTSPVSPSRSSITAVPSSSSGLRSTGRASSTPAITSLPRGYTLIPITFSISRFTENITIPFTTVKVTVTFIRTRTSSFTSASSFNTTITSNFASVSASPINSMWSTSGSQGSIPVTTVLETQTLPTTITSEVTTKIGGVSTVLETETSTFASTLTGVVIPRVGEVTFTLYSTLIPQIPVSDPIKITSVEVIEETVVTHVYTHSPVVVTVDPPQEVKTQVIEEKVRTGVTQVGGSEVINTVVITPVPGVRVSVVTNVGGTPVTEVMIPNPVTNIRVVDGVERTVVETPPPQTVVRMEGGVLTTIGEVLAPGRIGQAVTYTVVNTPGGTPVTEVIVTTPAGPPFQPISYTVVREENGRLVTDIVVTTPTAAQAVTYTAVNTLGGTPVTEVIVTTPAGPPFQPISYTVVREESGRLVTDIVVTTPTAAQALTYTAVKIVGGTPVTEVFVTTPAGVPFQPVSYTITKSVGGTPTVVTVTPAPTTFVTTIDGTAVTRVTTPPVTSFTTTIGGTLTTQTIVTTPTGTDPITLTFTSTSGGTLSTFTSTISGTTRLSTISRSLQTTISTPSPSTSFSTRPKSSVTRTSTVEPSTTGPPEADKTTIVVGTKVYKWTEVDIFVGTFLPALLGIALVIPLRIIDLNAKLYQPFQSLARDKGGFGSETLLMQYTGVMAFLTPVVTMLQGHPIPFITTLMVGCASFMVPLATEAIGLKLHGKCYLNTASKTCAPALGVSPTPARALMGLIAAVIIMLCLVLFFLSRYTTGVYANPWNIAGIASLAGNAQIRIQQNSEEGMKKALAEKQFGLGWFTNAAGREDYGITLKDEAGRSLQPQQSAGVESDSMSELFDANAAAAKASESGNHLPFMTLRYPWRIGMILFQLGVFVFIVVYHAYYRGGIRDGGRFWTSLTTNTFGVRFISAVIGVIIAFCWQSFFLSVSIMTPYQLMAKKTQTAKRSVLFSQSTNPFSGIYSAIKHRHIFLLCVSIAAILSEFLPVLLANVPFSLHQTSTAATACAVLSLLFLAVMLSVLVGSFFVRWPPMPVDPRCIAGVLYYVSQSHMLQDFEGVSTLEGKAKVQRVMEAGRRYYYGLLASGTWRRLGVDCDLFADGDESGTAYQGAAGVYAGHHGGVRDMEEVHLHAGGDLGGGGVHHRGGGNYQPVSGSYQVGARIEDQPAMY